MGRYPSIVAACFDMLTCRYFDNGFSVLTIDYALGCSDAGGDVSASRLAWQLSGIIAVMILPVGIPAYFGVVLWRNEKIIRRNPKCIRVIIFSPLFRFYKTDCEGGGHKWALYSEVFFLYQKMILVGVMRLLKPGLIQGAFSILISVAVMCGIAHVMPSKTEPCKEPRPPSSSSTEIQILHRLACLLALFTD